MYPTKGAENGHLQAERRALEDILANSTDCVLAVAFRRKFLHVAPVSRLS